MSAKEGPVTTIEHAVRVSYPGAQDRLLPCASAEVAAKALHVINHLDSTPATGVLVSREVGAWTEVEP